VHRRVAAVAQAAGGVELGEAAGTRAAEATTADPPAPAGEQPAAAAAAAEPQPAPSGQAAGKRGNHATKPW
jgi:hypothetical protein